MTDDQRDALLLATAYAALASVVDQLDTDPDRTHRRLVRARDALETALQDAQPDDERRT